MSRIHIYPEQEIARINQLKARIENYRSIDRDHLIYRITEKSWCVVEVIQHMIIAHNAYREKLNSTLKLLKRQPTTVDEIKSSMIPSMLLKRFPPKNEQIRSKMKTTKQFQPVFLISELTSINIDSKLDDLIEILNHLKESVEKYRMTNVEKVRFNSAIGSLVKFNVAEACEFILCHNERHFQQIDNILRSFKS